MMKATFPSFCRIGESRKADWKVVASGLSGFEVNSRSESGNLLPKRRLFN